MVIAGSEFHILTDHLEPGTDASKVGVSTIIIQHQFVDAI
jgi:hypothetical protein